MRKTEMCWLTMIMLTEFSCLTETQTSDINSWDRQRHLIDINRLNFNRYEKKDRSEHEIDTSQVL